MNNQNANRQTNFFPIYIGIGLSVVIIITGFLFSRSYYVGEYQPTIQVKQVTLANQSAQTASAVQAQQTADALHAQQTADAQATLVASNMTQTADAKSAQQTADALHAQQTADALNGQATATASEQTRVYIDNLLLTPTVTPVRTACNATVYATGVIFSDVPGIYYTSDGYQTIQVGTILTVDGYLFDDAFVHVIYNGKPGFVEANGPTLFSGCTPITADLHFLAGWMPAPGWLVLVDDTFEKMINIWRPYGQNGAGAQLPTSITQPDALLSIPAAGQDVVFSTDKLHNAKAPAFELHTYLTVQRQDNADAYIGFRFFEQVSSYFEVRFFRDPDKCFFDVYNGNNYLFTIPFKRPACYDQNYAITLSVDTDHNLKIIVNGFDSGSIPIPGLQGQAINGGIDFTVKGANVDYSYIVISAKH